MRPLETVEYKQIIDLLNAGYVGKAGERVRPKPEIAMILQLQASLGLRAGDVLRLTVGSFKNGKLEQREKKTGKLQWRDINQAVFGVVYDFAIEKKLGKDDLLFNYTVRGVNKELKKATDYLGLDNVATHSFRKMFATSVYESSGSNLELVKELLNHTSVATTQRYIRVAQSEINRASSQVNFMTI
jgi:integrase